MGHFFHFFEFRRGHLGGQKEFRRVAAKKKMRLLSPPPSLCVHVCCRRSVTRSAPRSLHPLAPSLPTIAHGHRSGNERKGKGKAAGTAASSAIANTIASVSATATATHHKR